MYKQTVYGITSPLISIVFEIFTILIYTSVLEATYKTSAGNIFMLSIYTLLFLAVSFYIFIATITKYEYAILDNELIMRKFVNKKPVRIYSVKLIRSNCIYHNKRFSWISPFIRNTHCMYLWTFRLLKKTCAVVFVDGEGVRRKLIFKPDEALDEEIYRIKTSTW